MNKIILLLIFWSSFNVFCQSKTNYTVIYKVANVDFISNQEKKSELLDDIKQNAESQQFQLDFNNSLSHFFVLENLNSDVSQTKKLIIKLAKIRFTCDFNYFLDKTNSEEYFEKQNGVLIKNNYTEKKWEISSESKMIDIYLCYKATYNYDYIGRDKKTKTRTIIAWFAPQIPFSYGPKNYNGLPGLILELTDLYTTFLATKIESKEKSTISLPLGKTMTFKEYEQKVLTEN